MGLPTLDPHDVLVAQILASFSPQMSRVLRMLHGPTGSVAGIDLLDRR